MPGLITLTNTGNGLDSLDFSSPPSCTTQPTSGTQLANKNYVDAQVGAIDVTNSSFTQPILQILNDASGNVKRNTALGQNALAQYNSLSIGTDNTCLGYNSLLENLQGEKNTAVGVNSLRYNTEGVSNTAIGYDSLSGANTGNYNTAVGMNSMVGVSNGSHYNVAIGYDAGNGGTSTWGNGSYGITLLGAGTSINGVYTYSTAVGSTAQIKKSNQIVLGTANEVVTIPKFTTAGVVHNLANGDLTSTLIFTSDISNNAITSAKIADNAITSAKIADGTILGSDISSNAITADLLALDISYNGTFKVKDIVVGTSPATQVANKGYVDQKVSALAGLTAPASLDTLSEIASVIADSSGNRIFALDASMNLNAPLASPTFTGTVRISTITPDGVVHTDVSGNLSSSKIITSDISDNAITSAKIADGTITSLQIANATITSAKLALDLDLSGNPTATTQSSSDNTTRIATTAFVKAQSYAPLASPTFTGTVKVSSLNTSGVVHTDVSGNLSTSSIIDADITNGAITSAKLVSNLDLSGNPTTTTQDITDNSTKIATTAYVKNQSYITSSSLGVMSLSQPVSPLPGSFYFDLSGNLFKVYGSSGWVSTTLS
jgi:hypothetical protein